jgi:hypothetical protein
MTPGVSILRRVRDCLWKNRSGLKNVRLTFEIFHNIKESIVHIWLISKLDLDLVKVAERVLRFKCQHSKYADEFVKNLLRKVNGSSVRYKSAKAMPLLASTHASLVVKKVARVNPTNEHNKEHS